MLTVRRTSGSLAERPDKDAPQSGDEHDPTEPFADAFGALECLTDEVLAPGASLAPDSSPDAELITCVHQGALAYEDSSGSTRTLRSGEFQRISGTGCRGERNASLTKPAHISRISLRCTKAGSKPRHEKRRFTSTERWGELCLIASPDAREGSLRIDADALLYTGILPPGQHRAYPLGHRRSAWLHVVQGSLAIGGLVLVPGDGAGIVAERVLSFTALEQTTVLLLDLDERPWARATPAPGLPRVDAEAPTLSWVARFKILWDALTDVLGPAGTATLVGRAAHEAAPRAPELSGFAITRAVRDYSYVVPASFHSAGSMPSALRELLSELRRLLVQMTGPVVLRTLDRIPALRGWDLSPEQVQQ